MKITIIGAGNMGGAIARGLVAFRYSPSDITCTARTHETLFPFKEAGFNVATDNHSAVNEADMVVFAVKPWLMEEVINDVAPFMNPGQIVVSVAAGITFAQLSQWLGMPCTMFRVIPNTAIEYGCGVTFVSSSNASAADREVIMEMFSAMGYALEVQENMMAAGTALASCGIAYAMKYIQASAAGGEALGFSSEQARSIVEYTVKGAAELLLATGKEPQVEIDKVTTPGGMTQKGLQAMEQAGFSDAVRDGLDACLK